MGAVIDFYEKGVALAMYTVLMALFIIRTGSNNTKNMEKDIMAKQLFDVMSNGSFSK